MNSGSSSGSKSSVPSLSSPKVSSVRKPNGLLPVDTHLEELRKHVSVAPHSGALFQKPQRKHGAKGYPGQSRAHDAMRESSRLLSAQATTTEPLSPLEVALHMTASHLHATLPGPELESGLTGGYSIFKDTRKLDKKKEKRKLSAPIHEAREQVKSNLEEAAQNLPNNKRKRITMPSPPRDTMEHGGGYRTSGYSARHLAFDDKDASGPALSVEQQRQLARDVIEPLLEPAWKPKARAKDEIPTPFHGRGVVSEVMPKFTAQDPHMGEIGKNATASYKAGTTPDDSDIRVVAENSGEFFSTKRKKKNAGLHEVIPTDTAPLIASLPTESRMPVAYAQADVRTNTALTLFRGKVGDADEV